MIGSGVVRVLHSLHCSLIDPLTSPLRLVTEGHTASVAARSLQQRHLH